MPSGIAGVCITFLIACASAAFFLLLRCHGNGRPFGRRCWHWATMVVVTTGLVSTAAAFAASALVAQLPFAVLGFGAVGPSGLWLAEIRRRREERGLLQDLSSLWLSRLLARLEDGMAADRMAWCEDRVDPEWERDELGMAARFYQEYLRERMSGDERRRSRLYAQVSGIEARLSVIQLVETGAGRAKLSAALLASRATKAARHRDNLDDPSRLADVLRHDAERELIRLLSFAHSSGHYRMPAFSPPQRGYSPVRPTLSAAPGQTSPQAQRS